MKKFLKNGLSLFLMGCLVVSSSTLAFATDTPVEVSNPMQSDSPVEVPNYMQPDSVLIYDNNLNYNFERGGELTIPNTESSDVIAVQGMKAVYDKNGLLRNVYYPVPGEPGSYQLKNPMAPRNNSGVKEPGSGKYTYKNCVLNFKSDKVTGTGQITYYGQPDGSGPYVGDHNVNGKPYYLKVGDCATKIYVDDVPTGVVVKATNTKNNHTKNFTKNDCGTLPNAILDIFEDGTWSKNGICGLTVNGVKDSVDNGTISHPYKK